MSVTPPPGEPTPADRAAQTARVPQPAPIAPVSQVAPVPQAAAVPQAATVPQAAPGAVAGPTAGRRVPRRGVLVAALVVAIALLVGSVAVTAVWAHDASGSFATVRPGVEKVVGPNGRVMVRPDMPGRMFGGVPGERRELPRPVRPGQRPTPSPSPTA